MRKSIVITVLILVLTPILGAVVGSTLDSGSTGDWGGGILAFYGFITSLSAIFIFGPLGWIVLKDKADDQVRLIGYVLPSLVYATLLVAGIIIEALI